MMLCGNFMTSGSISRLLFIVSKYILIDSKPHPGVFTEYSQCLDWKIQVCLSLISKLRVECEILSSSETIESWAKVSIIATIASGNLYVEW